MEPTAQFVAATASLVGALAWPALLLFVLVKFREPLNDFFNNLSELSVKAPGLEASARRQQIQAAVAVGAAIAKDAELEVRDPSLVANDLAGTLPDARRQRELQGAIILWVDDRPNNNRYERAALEALGLRFVLATSTDEALEQLARQTFELVISDMGRPPDARAGYTLLDQMRGGGDNTPFVIYAGSRAPEHVQEARQHGAYGCTNSPQELIRMVIEALGHRAGV